MRLISGRHARRLVEKNNALLCDARDPVSFRDGSITGAKNYPIRLVSTLARVEKKTPLIFFGKTNDDTDMIMAAKYAAQMGFQDIHLLGAMTNWDR